MVSIILLCTLLIININLINEGKTVGWPQRKVPEPSTVRRKGILRFFHIYMVKFSQNNIQIIMIILVMERKVSRDRQWTF